MRFIGKLVLLVLTASAASTAFAASIAGNVKGPDGNPLMGVFVVAENSQNKITVTVLWYASSVNNKVGYWYINR